jgi:glyoxylase-like metal-dependent hydrolase (beta-lactamase superfamily II)
MLVERAMHPQFLSNTYLVADGQTAGAEKQQDAEPGAAIFIDAGGPVEPLIEAAERLQVEPSHVLLTHHHFDHVSEAGKLRERWPAIEVLIDPLERGLLGEDLATGTVEAGETLQIGRLTIRPLHTPGHTVGMLSFLISEAHAPRPVGAAGEAGALAGGASNSSNGSAVVFTGDTLFKGSVGGVRAPGHTSYQDLKDSIMGTLMELPGGTVIHPGHADASTVEREWEENAFIRIWRGLDREGAQPCEALGHPATLVLLAADYDGGHKAWVRWSDGSDDIVPGSRVEVAS